MPRLPPRVLRRDDEVDDPYPIVYSEDDIDDGLPIQVTDFVPPEVKITEARRLGQAWMDPVLFASIVADSRSLEDALDLVRVSSHISTLQEAALYMYVEQQVWPSEVRTAFFLQQPLEEELFRLQSSSKWDVFSDFRLYVFLSTAISKGALASRVFTAVSNKVIDAVKDTYCIRSLLDFVLTVLHRDSSLAPQLNDCKFFLNLVHRRDFASLISYAVSLSEYDCFQDHFPIILHKCTTFLRSGMTDPDIRRNALRLLERFTSTWHSVVSRVLAESSPSGWRADMGRLLKQMLTSTSVEFVLRVEGFQQLDSLILFAFKTSSEEDWMEVLCRLKLQWPQRVREVLKEPVPAQSITDVTCPITLTECVYPVVASDGHTYERDALMQHMAIRGAFSPITRGVISYHLFANRAVHLPERV